jgi:phosphate uptake regulator
MRLQLLTDHTTNITEEVVCLVEGEIIRHAPYPQG